MKEIFESQRQLNEKLVPGITEQCKDPEKMTEWILKFKLAMDQEGAEMVDCLPWPWWKKVELDKQNLKVEFVDMLFFWVSMCLSAGFTAEEMTSAYFQKLKINHERADKGYKTGEYSKIDKDGNEDNRRIK